MKHLKKIFESTTLGLDSEELTYLQNIIEDTLIDTMSEVKVSLVTDTYEEFSGSKPIYYTTSVEFKINPQLPESFKFMVGNPYSGDSIDIEDAFDRQDNYVNQLAKFNREIKSLCFRLNKLGYVINAYKFTTAGSILTTGILVTIWFMVQDEKIVRNDS